MQVKMAYGDFRLPEAVVSCEYYNLTSDLTMVQEKPGIYSWHLFCPGLDIGDLLRYWRALNDSRVNISVEGNFSNSWEGEIGQEDCQYADEFEHRLSESNKIDIPLALQLLAHASMFFSPSLYIGKAKNLRSRILQHRRSIEHYREMDPDKDDPLEDELLTSEERKEINTFGRKMGAMLDNDYRTFQVFVKVVSIEQSGISGLDEIAQVEYFLNRTFNPKFGVK